MSTDAALPLSARFEVTPHVSDGGGGSLAGTLQLIAILSSVGILLGLAVSYVSQWLYLILLFPIGMGLVMGFVGGRTIERYKIRKPFICGIAGFAAGFFCFLAMHYCDYRRFESQLAEVPEGIREIARNINNLDSLTINVPAEATEEATNEAREAAKKEINDIAAEMRKTPETVAALSVDSFWGFMDLQATQGVTLSKAGRGGGGVNLGYTGSWIYWSVEALIVAIMAFAIMKTAAERPYCLQCGTWKTELALLWSGIEPKAVAETLEQGDLAALEHSLTTPDSPVAKPGVRTKIAMDVCKNCESTAPFEVKVVKVKTNAKGETSDSKIAHITYPGEALEPLRSMATRLTTPPPAEGPQQPAA